MLLVVAGAMDCTVVHVTICPAAEHVQPGPFAVTKLRPLGNVSVTVIAVLVLAEPTVLIATLYTPLAPTVNAPLTVLLISRSVVAGVTIPVCVAVDVGSGGPLVGGGVGVPRGRGVRAGLTGGVFG